MTVAAPSPWHQRISVTLRQHYPLPCDPHYRRICYTDLWKTNFITVIEFIRYGSEDNLKVAKTFPLKGTVKVSVFLIPSNVSSRTIASEILGIYSLLDGQAIDYEEIQTQPKRLSNKDVLFNGSDLLDHVGGFLQKLINKSCPTLQANLVIEKLVTVSKNEFQELTCLHKHKQKVAGVMNIVGKDYVQHCKAGQPCVPHCKWVQPCVQHCKAKQPGGLHKFMLAVKSMFKSSVEAPPGKHVVNKAKSSSVKAPPVKKVVLADRERKEELTRNVIQRARVCTCVVCRAVHNTHRQG